MADFDAATLAKFQKFQAMIAESPELVEALKSPEILAMAVKAAEKNNAERAAGKEFASEEEESEEETEGSYPTIEVGHTDDVSVMSEMTTPTVMTRQTMDTEENYPEIDGKGNSASGNSGGPLNRIGLKIGVNASEDGSLPPPPTKSKKRGIRRRVTLVKKNNANKPLSKIREDDGSQGGTESTASTSKRSHRRSRKPSSKKGRSLSGDEADLNGNRSGSNGRGVNRNRSMPLDLEIAENKKGTSKPSSTRSHDGNESSNNGSSSGRSTGRHRRFSTHSSPGSNVHLSPGRHKASNNNEGNGSNKTSNVGRSPGRLRRLSSPGRYSSANSNDGNGSHDSTINGKSPGRFRRLSSPGRHNSSDSNERNGSNKGRSPGRLGKLSPGRHSAAHSSPGALRRKSMGINVQLAAETNDTRGRSSSVGYNGRSRSRSNSVPRMRLVPAPTRCKSNASADSKPVSLKSRSDFVKSRAKTQSKLRPSSIKKTSVVYQDDGPSDESPFVLKKPSGFNNNLLDLADESSFTNDKNETLDIDHRRKTNSKSPVRSSGNGRWSPPHSTDIDAIPAAFKATFPASISPQRPKQKRKSKDWSPPPADIDAIPAAFKATFPASIRPSKSKEKQKTKDRKNKSISPASKRASRLAGNDETSRNSKTEEPRKAASLSSDEEEEDYVPQKVRKPGKAVITKSKDKKKTTSSAPDPEKFKQFLSVMNTPAPDVDASRPDDFLSGSGGSTTVYKKKEPTKKYGGNAERVDDWLGSGKTQKRTWKVKGT